MLDELRATEFRTLFSWADWEREEGREWFDWFIGELKDIPRLHIVPILAETPIARALPDREGARRGSHPPADLSSFTEYVNTIVQRYGGTFEWVQLWDKPNADDRWSRELDPDGARFALMATESARLARSLGKRVALGALEPLDFTYLARMDAWGLLGQIDAVAFHECTGHLAAATPTYPLDEEVRALRALIHGLDYSCDIWLTTAAEMHGRKTPDSIAHFEHIRALPLERTYWDSVVEDEGAGLLQRDGIPTPLFGHWKRVAQEEMR
jgi:hypothetical protein